MKLNDALQSAFVAGFIFAECTRYLPFWTGVFIIPAAWVALWLIAGHTERKA